MYEEDPAEHTAWVSVDRTGEQGLVRVRRAGRGRPGGAASADAAETSLVEHARHVADRGCRTFLDASADLGFAQPPAWPAAGHGLGQSAALSGHHEAPPSGCTASRCPTPASSRLPRLCIRDDMPEGVKNDLYTATVTSGSPDAPDPVPDDHSPPLRKGGATAVGARKRTAGLGVARVKKALSSDSAGNFWGAISGILALSLMVFTFASFVLGAGDDPGTGASSTPPPGPSNPNKVPSSDVPSTLPTPVNSVPVGQPISAEWSGEYGGSSIVPVESLDLTDKPQATFCDETGYRTWLKENGAVAAPSSRSITQLRTNEAATLVVLGVNVRIVSREPMTPGVYTACATGGTPGPSGSFVDVNLDRSRPVVKFRDTSTGPARDQLTIPMVENEQHLLIFRVTATASTVKITCGLDVLVNGERMTIPLITAAEPLAVSGVAAGTPVMIWANGRWNQQ